MSDCDDLEELKRSMEGQGLAVAVTRDASGQIRVDVLAFDPDKAVADCD